MPLRKKANLSAGTSPKKRKIIAKNPKFPFFKLRDFAERELFLNGKRLRQRTTFIPENKQLLLQIVDKTGIVSRLDIRLFDVNGNSYARVKRKDTVPHIQSNGLMLQMMAEAISVLKQVGVKGISSEPIGGFGIYKTLGFSRKKGHGESSYYLKLN